jgi:hypothetical protein
MKSEYLHKHNLYDLCEERKNKENKYFKVDLVLMEDECSASRQ